MTLEQKLEVELFAGLYGFTKQDICMITGVDIEDEELDDCIRRGELLAKAKVLKSKFGLAETGSSEAQKQVEKLIKKSKKKKF
jgi:hypothetical protein